MLVTARSPAPGRCGAPADRSQAAERRHDASDSPHGLLGRHLERTRNAATCCVEAVRRRNAGVRVAVRWVLATDPCGRSRRRPRAAPRVFDAQRLITPRSSRSVRNRRRPARSRRATRRWHRLVRRGDDVVVRDLRGAAGREQDQTDDEKRDASHTGLNARGAKTSYGKGSGTCRGRRCRVITSARRAACWTASPSR